MTPATRPRSRAREGRLLVVAPETGRFEDRTIRELPRLLRAGDLLVVNDAATLPASLSGMAPSGEPVEVRLARRGGRESEWTAVLLGRGDWRTRTEDRPPPPRLVAGDVIRFGEDLAATVERVSPHSPRLVDLSFDRKGSAFWESLYRRGRPIQYSYLEGPLALWDVQSSFGARPWAIELPSAGRPLDAELFEAMRRAGVKTVSVTHEAGLSSTGDPRVDARLPLSEHFDLPAATVAAQEDARAQAGRVIAVGTTVVRALEGAASLHGGRLTAGAGVTDLRVDGGFTRRIVDGLLTGLHEPGTSHFALTRAFASEHTLVSAYRHAEAAGYLGHEFGDSMLILPADSAGRAPRLV